MEDTSFDMTGYNRFVTGLELALIGTGQDGDMQLVAKVEARQLAMGISSALGPRTQEAGQKKLERDIRKEFAPGPDQVFDQAKRKSKVFETDITWLYAGPAFLVGVRDADYQPQMSQSAMQAQFNAARAAGFARGNARVELGRRGKQHVYRWNRTIVSRERFAAFARSAGGRIGRLRAMFAATAKQLGQKRIPQWLNDQIDKVKADSTAIFRITGSGAAFAIEFGARAPGVASNPHIQKAIHGAVETRRHKLKEKMEKILAGYAYDWQTGRVFRRNRGEEMLRELEANEELYQSL